MIIDKLYFGTTRLPIVHTSASSNAHNYLFVQGATDGSTRKLRDQRSSRSKHAAFGAAHIFSIDKKAGIAPRQLSQSFVDRAQHRKRAFGTARYVFTPFRDRDYMLHDPIRGRLRLLENLTLSSLQFSSDLFANTLD